MSTITNPRNLDIAPGRYWAIGDDLFEEGNRAIALVTLTGQQPFMGHTYNCPLSCGELELVEKCLPPASVVDALEAALDEAGACGEGAPLREVADAR